MAHCTAKPVPMQGPEGDDTSFREFIKYKSGNLRFFIGRVINPNIIISQN